MASRVSFSLLLLLFAFAAKNVVGETTTPKPEILNRKPSNFGKAEWDDAEGDDLFEGDIRLTEEQKRLLLERKAIPYDSSRWPEGGSGFPEVPYTIDSSFSAEDTAAVEAGIAHWEEHTCITFHTATDTSVSHLQFVGGGGCSSYVGKINTPGQAVTLGTGCFGLGTVAHEIGHAMGLYHEQSRSDRDEHVVIVLDNVKAGKENNFEKRNDRNYSVPYDFSSNMHYGARFFSKNAQPTIITVNPLAQELIGQRTGLSHRDKLIANRMYDCIDKWLAACGVTEDPCENGGYFKKTGTVCGCVCPSGTSGDNCETVVEDYYESLLSGCSETVTTETTITSPNHPSTYNTGITCIKYIVAPECNTITITFSAFTIYQQSPKCENDANCCYYEMLEIRTDDMQSPGQIFCGTDIGPGTFTSTGNQMLLNFVTATSWLTGWSADVTFAPDPSCTPQTTIQPIVTTPPPTTIQTTPPPMSEGDCDVEMIGPGLLSWTSPNFGESDYPNDAFCFLESYSEVPRWAIVIINTFNLEPSLERTLTDFVSISRPEGFKNLTLSGIKSGSFKLPSANFYSVFLSNEAVTSVGFNITIKQMGSKCHKLIETGNVGSSGVISSPKRNKIWTKNACEWWIRSPEGTRIRLKFFKMKLTKPCFRSSVIVDRDGDKMYPRETSSRHCGTKRPSPIVSNENELNVLFHSSKNKKFFKARWTVI